jgi:ribosomal protein S14
MLRSIKLHERAAERLIKIAENHALTNPNNASKLPASMRTLAELARIPSTTLEGHIKDGTVHVGMERSEVEGLIGRKDRKPTHGSAKPPPAKRRSSSSTPNAERGDIGPASLGETERLHVRVEELQADKRRLEMKVAGLESEIEEAKAVAKPAPKTKIASRCSICHEKNRAVLRPVFICDNCVDIYEVREAAPPDDGLDILRQRAAL